MENNAFDAILAKAGNVPGVRVDREKFLKKAFKSRYSKKEVDKILLKGPLGAGVSLEMVGKVADEVIRAESSGAIALSAITGIFGGLAMLVTMPTDILQFYAHIFKVIQKLMYLYGWEEDIFDEDGNMDDATRHVLILYFGIMSGVGMAGKVASNLAKMAAKSMLRDVSKQTLKEMIKNPIIRVVVLKILQTIGIKVTSKTTMSTVTKFVPPVAGSLTSGALTAAFFLPMSHRLKRYLETGVMDDCDTEDEAPGE